MKTLTPTRLVLFVSVAAGASASTGTAQQAATVTAPGVTLPNTYVHMLRSKVNGRTYRIEVALPSAYVGAKPDDLTRYPTLYLLDGVWDFPLLFSHMQFGAMVRPTRIILVGVAAADSQAQRRGFDYTPPLTAADSAYFKGALHPPPVGGLFVAYAMLEQPDLFTRYAMISPSLWYPWGRDKGIILAREPDFAKQHPTFPKTVYVSVGSEEDPNMIAVGWQFVGQLCNSISNGYYKGLDLGAETLPGEPHGSPAARVHVLAALYSADSTRPKPGRGVMQHCR